MLLYRFYLIRTLSVDNVRQFLVNNNWLTMWKEVSKKLFWQFEAIICIGFQRIYPLQLHVLDYLLTHVHATLVKLITSVITPKFKFCMMPWYMYNIYNIYNIYVVIIYIRCILYFGFFETLGDSWKIKSKN